MKTVPKIPTFPQPNLVQRELDKTQLREEMLSLAKRLKELHEIWRSAQEGPVTQWEPQRQAAYWRAQSTISQLRTAFRKLLAAYRQLLPTPPEPRKLEVVYDLQTGDEIGYLEIVRHGGVR